ncbi:MAG: 4-hydroxyphenylacetate 3-monooxygenase oxygenase component [Candidatus Tectimicrobiota bacterium]|nr:MAG: 4-hydroxyphenylacetate 3-monooxygenase oxygenase component [Candidatus Tectomicrobia bacterium]
MAARSGKEYLQGLRDGREVWLGGERVADVTTHPALRRGAQTLARLYDLQYDPELHELMTYPSPKTGEPVGRSFQPPYTREDLVARRRMMKVWADATCGMMGRTPDFLNVTMMIFAMRRDFFAQGGERYGDNIVRYYEYVRDHDLCLTHTLINPQIDRSKPASQQAEPDLALRKVGETAEGILVRGARMLATLAPYSDELAVYPYTPLQPDEDDYALVFAIPVATPGLRFICRDSFDRGDSPFDHPLASRFEEMDCMVVFDDVLVPWERVFVNANAKLYNALMPSIGTMAHTGHQIAVKNIAKCEFVVGVAQRIVETIGIGGFLHVQEKMGELITYLETIKACVYAAEAQAQPGPGGVLYPAMDPLHCSRNLFPKWYPRMIEILQLLGAGGFMLTPSAAAVKGPLKDIIARYYQGAGRPARERIQLFRLAWDLVGEAIGSRQVLYERFFGGDPVRNLAARYRMYDLSACVAHVDRLLAMAEAD